jgi:hypothetical protein
MTAAAPPSFRAPLTRPMRRRGLKGRFAELRCEGPLLRFRGAEAGEFALSASMVARMLVGVHFSKLGPLYKTHIWRSDEHERLTLQPYHSEGGYGAVIGAFAEAVQRAAGPGRIETGIHRRDALFLPVAFGIVGTLLVAFGWIEMADRPLWEPMVPTSIFLALEGLIVWDCWRSRWPRKVTSLDALALHLPQVRT